MQSKMTVGNSFHVESNKKLFSLLIVSDVFRFSSLLINQGSTTWHSVFLSLMKVATRFMIFMTFHFVIVPLCKMRAVGFFLNNVCQIKKCIIYHGSTETRDFNDLVVNPIIWWLLKKYFRSPICM